MEFRQATLKDLDEFVATRVEFLTLIRVLDDVAGFRENTRAYLREHLERDDLVVYLALDEDRIVSSCMACLYQTTPLPSCLTGRAAELLNVYTLPEYRRMGLAETLVRLLLDELARRGVEKVILDYTDDGLPLYEKLGFTRLPYQMQLKLPAPHMP